MKPLATAKPVSKPRTPSRRRAWTVVALLFALMVVNFADKAVIGLAAKPIMRDLGLDATQFGLLSSGFFLMFVLSAVGIGFLGDRVPARWLLLGMAVLWSLSQAPMIGVAGFGVVLAGRGLLGFGEGPAVPIAQHAAHKWFDNRERNLVSGIIQSGATLGVVIASPVLTWLIVEYNWHVAFAALCAAGLVWALLWLVLGREGPSDARTLAQRDTSAAIGLLEATHVPYRRVLACGTWLACLVGGFTVQWTLGVMTTWLPDYLSRLGYSPSQVGLLNTVPWLVMGALFLAQSLLSRWLAGRGVSSRVHRGLAAGVLLFCSAVAMALFPSVRQPGLQLTLITIAFSFCEIMAVVGPAVIAEITPTTRRSGVLGVYLGLGSIGAVLSPTVTGSLVDAASTPLAGFRWAFLLTAALALTAGAAATFLIRPERDARRLAAPPGGETSGQ
ncbi:MFS transporter [Amycolatopsis sp. A1MSW2902]|uniref:MFS transporter n=1 Tax=Amycolatopsis sp. A1MSW2902 TaxID=687413 RepID=UPI00307F59E2